MCYKVEYSYFGNSSYHLFLTSPEVQCGLINWRNKSVDPEQLALSRIFSVFKSGYKIMEKTMRTLC